MVPFVQIDGQGRGERGLSGGSRGVQALPMTSRLVGELFQTYHLK